MAMAGLVAASAAFVGSHLVMSHPLRRPLVARLGEKGFLGLYSLVAFATLAAMGWAKRSVGPQAPLFDSGLPGWIAASVLTWLAAILFVGSLRGNPALPGAHVAAAPVPGGVFRITRHPMMWGFALWALAHALVWPTPDGLVVDAAIGLLALVGAAGQDAKKAAQPGSDWRAWQAVTGFVPFSRGWALPGWPAFAVGTLLWLAATFAHGALGGHPAGIWLFFH